MKCKKIETCIFYNDEMENMPETAEMEKFIYCLNDYNQCARYRVAIKTGKAPIDLYPTDALMADRILGV